jgi:chromosomal replication initiation ATPase DnaA
MKILNDILTDVCNLYEISVEEIKTDRTRNSEISVARAVFCNIAARTGYKYDEIGKEINKTKSDVSFYVNRSGLKSTVLYRRGIIELATKNDFIGYKI